MMSAAATRDRFTFGVSKKECDWVILEKPQPHRNLEITYERGSRMWKGELTRRDLDDIRRYRALVGRGNSTITTSSLNSPVLSDYANSCRKWMGFAEAAAACGRGCDRRAPVGVLPGTPECLVSTGVPDLPICHTVRHIVRETTKSSRNHRHGLDPALLASVPELLERPVAVFGAGPGRVAVALDATDGLSRPLVAYIDVAVPLEIGGGGYRKGDLVNFMLSVYGRHSLINEIESAERSGEGHILDSDALRRLDALARQGRKAA